MFASSYSRIQDRGGGGNGSAASTKPTARRQSKSLTSVSSSAKISSKLSTEKENRRSSSRGAASGPTQKPTIRPVPRVNKASLLGGEARGRSSNSSVPRGRSSSPFGFHNVLPDARKSRRASMDLINQKGYRDFNTKGNVPVRCGSKSFGDVEEKAIKNGVNAVVESESSGVLDKKVEESEKMKSFISSNFIESSAIYGKGNLQICDDKFDPRCELQIQIGVSINGHKEDYAEVLDTVKDKGPENKRDSRGVGCKYPSRLQEKLTFLEGKVKKIASGIRKTKEMLDMKNPDSSKAILSDFQDKILGIEKAMSHVASGSDAKMGLLNTDGQADLKYCDVQETDVGPSTAKRKDSLSTFNQKYDIDHFLAADEKLDEFDDQGSRQGVIIGEERGDASNYSLNEIGNKTCTGGWFVSEGESVLLAHDDSSCSYYDTANCEEKAVYVPPPEISRNMWRDCWLIRSTGSDGSSARLVVAASAGNALDSGFCTWDFYTKEVRALYIENEATTSSRTMLRPLPNNIARRRNPASDILPETRRWWYKPCGPLIISTATSQKEVKAFDVRDGEQIMRWEVQKPVLAMEYSSPLQWRNRGKVVITEEESISVWDVNSVSPRALLSIPSSRQNISALHVCNTETEIAGGIRKRVSSSEAEGNDGVFCTSNSINILDFRQPSGVGLRLSTTGVNVQSVFSRGDFIYLGGTNSSSMSKQQSTSLILQFSLRRQGLFSTYAFPQYSVHSNHAAITQVWGNSDFGMGVSGLGLHVFDAQRDDIALRDFNMGHSNTQRSVREVIGPDDLYCPSFDYMGSRALLISRDRPAMWRHLLVS